jgi:HD-GYP domain-containing protein (c-di-GMP phosphodiesterase class II)
MKMGVNFENVLNITMKFDLLKLAEVFSRSIDESIAMQHIRFDFKGKKVYYTNYHQFKVAHFAVHLAQLMGLSILEQRDILLMGMLHDVGFVSSEIMLTKENKNYIISHENLLEHCIVGEKLIKNINFNTDIKNVIMFHHEHYDGSGFFKLQKEEIPLYSRIISIADNIDLLFNLNDISGKKDLIINYLKTNSGIKFDPYLVEKAIEMFDIYEHVDYSVRCDNLPFYEVNYNWLDIKSVTETFMKIIDSKSHFTYTHSSSITKYVDKLAIIYNYNEDMKKKLHIAANLHDMALTNEEYEIIKKHSFDGEKMLSLLNNFEDISRWVGQHHEKLNGSGYPKGLINKEIDFESQIIAAADIFTALREERPYRDSFSLDITKEIMNDMVKKGEINGEITNKLFNIVS